MESKFIGDDGVEKRSDIFGTVIKIFCIVMSVVLIVLGVMTFL